MDFGKLNSPAEVRYFTLSPSSTALRAMMRRPFFRTIVSAAARLLKNRSTTQSETPRIRLTEIMRRYLPILIRGREFAPPALFPHAEYDYTSSMKVGGVFFALWCLLAPAAFPEERSPHELYDVIKALRVDPPVFIASLPQTTSNCAVARRFSRLRKGPSPFS